jgi:hypothetical protein
MIPDTYRKLEPMHSDKNGAGEEKSRIIVALNVSCEAVRCEAVEQ